MTLLRLSPRALTRCRFAISPLAETLATLIAYQRGHRVPAATAADRSRFVRWRESEAVRGELLALVSSTKWMPDMLVIPPLGGLRTRLDDELRSVAGFGDDQVRAAVRESLAAAWKPVTTSWTAGTGLGPAVAAVLESGWAHFVRPEWTRRRAILERDIAHWADRLAAEGWRAVVEAVSPSSSWHDADTVRFGRVSDADQFVEDGIIFVPKTPESGSWTCEHDGHFGITYPARGAAVLDTPTLADADLARLVGAGRARVLRALELPATSTELAGILGVSLGTVSAHLAALRASGVVRGIRDGREVRYHLDTRGQAIAAAFRGTP